MTATLSLAPHVGTFVAATDLAGGRLLAIALAAGGRGDVRVSVLDTGDWSLVATFPIPSRARSGITPIQADGDVLVAGDDHTVVAIEARTGRRVWERAFPAPARASLVDVRAGRVLVSIEHEEYRMETRLLRAADGADEAVLPAAIVASLMAPALGPSGELALASMKIVDVVRAGHEPRRIPLVTRRYGAIDAAELDEHGARLAIGTRAGEVLVLDLASEVATTVLETDEPVRCVGFHRGAPWAMDARARLWILGEGDARVRLDLGLQTYGGLLAEDGASIALSDLDTRTFRVRRLPSNEEVFATQPGFGVAAVGIDADGGLLASSADRLLRIDAGTGKVAKLGAGVHEVVRLASGAVVLVGAAVRALARGAAKPVALARSADDVAFAGGGATMVVTRGRAVEVWDLATAKRTFHLDLDKTWVGETNEAIRLAHLGPDGAPWIHLTDGSVLRGDRIGADDALVHRLDPDGALSAHPDGASLWHVRGRAIVRLALPGFEASAPLALPIDADVATLHVSPSGRRLVVRHRDGRWSSIDLATGRGVAIASPETSAAERAPHELYLVDLQTPAACAFGRDEVHVAWIDAGGITFADAASGAIAGRCVVAANGRDYVVTDGASFDWPGASTNKPTSAELEARDGGGRLDLAALRGRRAPGLLARLTR